MSTMMDDRRMFVAVAESGSFSEAAERTGIAVSTLSRRIARFEARLGVTLLERTTRHVGLTSAGRLYLSELRPLVERLLDLETRISATSGNAVGSLRVAAPAGLARPFFGSALAAFRAEYPGVVLIWSSGGGRAHPIRDGYDVVISDGRVVDAELIARRILRTRDICVASPRYLELHGEPTQAKELARHAVLSNHASGGPIKWPLLRGGSVTLQPALRCSDQSLLTEAVLHHVGIALLPAVAVQPFLDEGVLKVVLDRVVGARRDIHMVYSRKVRDSPLLRALGTFARDYVSAHGERLGLSNSVTHAVRS